MTSICLTAHTLSSTSLTMPSTSSSSSRGDVCRISSRSSLVRIPFFPLQKETRIHTNCRRAQKQVVCMAPDEEKLTRRNPLDFPIEWERPKPGRRPDIFPQFSPMKTPLPPPLPYDPPEEDEEEEEEKKEEEEENPEQEDPENPEKQ